MELDFTGCVGIVQARMGSMRLPGKVLQQLGRRNLLDEVIARGRASRVCDRVVVATSTEPQDDAVAKHCAENGVVCYRGSEGDVLDRMYQAALAENAKHVIRLTADNPLLDPKTLAGMTEHHIEEKADYTHCITSWGCALPYGVGVEIFTMESLEASWREGLLSEHREHVDEFVYEHPERFRILLGTAEEALRRTEFRFTVDTKDDLASMREIFSTLERDDELLQVGDVIAWLDEHPSEGKEFRTNL